MSEAMDRARRKFDNTQRALAAVQSSIADVMQEFSLAQVALDDADATPTAPIEAGEREALVEAITGGTISVDGEDSGRYTSLDRSDAENIVDAILAEQATRRAPIEDAEFIAATDPQTVLALIAEVERLRDIIERVDDILVRHYLDMSVATDLLPILAEADLT